MFTGLIEATGTIVARTPTGGAVRLVVAAPALAGRWRAGDSIAVSGVCLTAIPQPDAEHFAADLAQETLQRTTLGALAPGAIVNLELPTPAGSPLGGHVVQGHVDGVGYIESLVPLHEDIERTDWRLTVEAPAALAPQIVAQGSIALDGISLTVARLHALHPDGSLRFEVAIIPHTYKATHLHTLQAHAPVNIETDVLAKYAAQRSLQQHDWLTPEYLLANGY